MLSISLTSRMRMWAFMALLLSSSAIFSQTEAPAPKKWELGLRIDILEIGKDKYSYERQRSDVASVSMGAAAVATYRPSDKLFWRFGLGLSGYGYRQAIYDPATNRQTNERNQQRLSLTSLVGLGHTFAPFKHPRLQRFRLSTGLNLWHANTVYSKAQNLAYVIDQNGNEQTVEGNDFEWSTFSMGVDAFGWVEVRLSKSIHLGAEFSYGVYWVRAISHPVGPNPLPDPSSRQSSLSNINGLNSPYITLNHRF